MHATTGVSGSQALALQESPNLSFGADTLAWRLQARQIHLRWYVLKRYSEPNEIPHTPNKEAGRICWLY